MNVPYSFLEFINIIKSLGTHHHHGASYNFYSLQYCKQLRIDDSKVQYTRYKMRRSGIKFVNSSEYATMEKARSLFALYQQVPEGMACYVRKIETIQGLQGRNHTFLYLDKTAFVKNVYYNYLIRSKIRLGRKGRTRTRTTLIPSGSKRSQCPQQLIRLVDSCFGSFFCSPPPAVAMPTQHRF